eukprot:1503431-Pleurochrysis_carterae.AAC.10
MRRSLLRGAAELNGRQNSALVCARALFEQETGFLHEELRFGVAEQRRLLAQKCSQRIRFQIVDREPAAQRILSKLGDQTFRRARGFDTSGTVRWAMAKRRA